MSGRCAFRIDVAERELEFAENVDERNGEMLTESDAFGDIPTTDGVWQCSRPSGQSDYCPLHSPETTDNKVLTAIRKTVSERGNKEDTGDDDETGSHGPARFLGVRAGTLDLAGITVDSDSAALDFRFADIDELRLIEATVSGGLKLDSGEFGRLELRGLESGRGVCARNATIESDVLAEGCRIEGKLDFRFATVDGGVDISRATADGRFEFGFTEIGGIVEASKGTCGGRFTLKESDVGAVHADNIAVAGPDQYSDIPGLQFRGLTAERDVSLANCDCDGMLIAYDLTTGGAVSVSEGWIGDNVIFGKREGSNLPEATIGGSLDCSGATVEGTVKMRGRKQYDTAPEVGGFLRFDGAAVSTLRIAPALTHDRISVVSCRNASIHSGRLEQSHGNTPITYDLTEATVGSVTIDGGDGSVTDAVWFDRTTFDGFRFSGVERADFRAADWQLIDPNMSAADEISYVRAFPEATEYVADLVTLLTAQPGFRAWLRTTKPPYDTETVAVRVFEDIDQDETERIANNGPEKSGYFGRAVYEQERYRTGVVTYLARELNDQDHPIAPLFSEFGKMVQRLADAVAAEESTADASFARRHDSASITGLAQSEATVQSAMEPLRDELAGILGQQSDVAPSLEDREVTYIKARKGAEDIGDSAVAGNFFIHEGRLRRQAHRSRGAYHRYASNWLFDLVAGYGERPLRTLSASVVTVGLFGGLYGAIWRLIPAGTPSTYAGPFGAMLLSLSSFTAFVLGGIDVAPLPIRAVATVEAFTGAFLLALFVFTLTRSLHR